MKARVLKKILKNTGYNVNNNDGYIAVGSPLCHDLISVDKKTLNIKYALDTFNDGRKCLEKKDSQELLFIWDKLYELIESGQIHDIINGTDKIANPLPVYTVKDGQVVETFTDKYGWPNTTIDGYLLYDNEYFPTREQAIKKDLKEYKIVLKWAEESFLEKQKELSKTSEQIEKYKKYIKQKDSENTDRESGQVERIVSNRFFSIWGRKRKTPNEFTRLGVAVNNFKYEVFKTLKLENIVKWLNDKFKGC